MSMKKNQHNNTRAVVAITLLALFLVNFGGASMLAPVATPPLSPLRFDNQSTLILREMRRLGLLQNASQEVTEEILHYQRETGASLAEIVKNPMWAKRLGLNSFNYAATWYMANPFDVLPKDLQKAIKNDANNQPKSRAQLRAWCDRKNPVRAELWKKALNKALVETTIENLWRGARGARPFAHNGEFLKPIVIDNGNGRMVVQDGHIATDPALIPTNSTVLLLVRIQGVDRILKVKATDIGGGIRGRHVDLPIFVDGKNMAPMPHTQLPSKHIGNPMVRILTPFRKTNPGRKA
jgi:hypothetical protein